MACEKARGKPTVGKREGQGRPEMQRMQWVAGCMHAAGGLMFDPWFSCGVYP